MQKILLSAGGTGGHFFPAISFAEQIIKNQKYVKIYILTDQRCKKFITEDIHFKVLILNQYNKHKTLWNKTYFIFQNMILFFKTLFLILRLKPSIIVGFGGYNSFHCLLVAKILKIRTILYEANAILGRANKIFLKQAYLLLTAFKKTKSIEERYIYKTLYIGFLIREKIKFCKYITTETSTYFNILIYGGSQGASIFSELIPKVLKLLLTLNPKIKLKVIHQTPRQDIHKVKKLYEQLNVLHEVSDFFYNLDKIYPHTDLAIVRSGANSLAEILYLDITVFFIPLKHSKDNHQYLNVENISEKNNVYIYTEEKLSNKILAEEMNKIFSNRKKIIYQKNIPNVSFTENSDIWINKLFL